MSNRWTKKLWTKAWLPIVIPLVGWLVISAWVFPTPTAAEDEGEPPVAEAEYAEEAEPQEAEPREADSDSEYGEPEPEYAEEEPYPDEEPPAYEGAEEARPADGEQEYPGLTETEQELLELSPEELLERLDEEMANPDQFMQEEAERNRARREAFEAKMREQREREQESIGPREFDPARPGGQRPEELDDTGRDRRFPAPRPGAMRRDADRLESVPREELREIEERIQQRRSRAPGAGDDEPDPAELHGRDQVPAQPAHEDDDARHRAEPVSGRAGEPPTTTPPAPRRPGRPPSAPAGQDTLRDAKTPQPASRTPTPPGGDRPAGPTDPAVQNLPSSPGSNAPADASVPKDPKTGLPDLQAVKEEKPKWWSLPAEDRPYFFSWKNTGVDKVLADWQEMTGLSMLGMNLFEAKGAKPITFQSVKIMDYDEALVTLNLLIADIDYWVLQREEYLEIRRLTEWYRHIRPARMYSSVESYRAAKLPGWELASVAYEPQERSAATLAERAVDIVPLNTARATVIPNSNRVELKGFVYYIDRQLEYLEKLDKETSGDGRDLEVYELQYAAPDDAARLLEAMMPATEDAVAIEATPRLTPRNRRRPNPRRRNQPQPNASGASGLTSSADAIEITTDTRLNRLVVRATPAKHKMVDEFLTKYIDLPNEGGQTELIKLQHADPERMVELITPMLGEQEVIQLPTPKKRGNKPVRRPPPRVVTRTSAVLTPISHMMAILVKAPPDEMAQVKRFVEMLDVPEEEGTYQYMVLEHASATSVSTILTQAFSSGSMRRRRPRGGSSSTEAFQAIPDTSNDRGLILIGEAPDLAEAKSLIAELDVDPEQGLVEHLAHLKSAVPSAVASVLESRYGGATATVTRGRRRGYRSPAALGTTFPKFIPNDETKTLIVVCREENWSDIERMMKVLDETAEIAQTTKIYRFEHASATSLAAIMSSSFGGSSTSGYRRGRAGYGSSDSGPSFDVEPDANLLIVTADDEVHKKVAELIEELDQPTPADEVELRVIDLKTADVEYVVEKLEELFPDASQGSSRRGRYRGRYGAYGGGGGPAEVPISFVAETVSNRILVTSNQEDYDKAKDFAEQMDAQYAAQKFVRKTFPIKNVDPAEIRAVIDTMFETGSSGGGARYGRYRRTTSSSTPGGIKMSEVGSSLIVLAPEEQMAEIEKLINTLDKDSGLEREIRTYKVENAGPQGTANLARNLQQIFADAARRGRGRFAGPDTSPRFFGSFGSDVLMVSATADDMPKIDATVQEMMELEDSADTTLVIKHYDVVHADPDDVAEMVDPILKGKYQELMQEGGGRRRMMGMYGGQAGGPQVVAHRTGSKVMVSAPETLLPLVENLIKEFDTPSEPSTMRIITLEKAVAEDLAMVVDQQINEDSSGGSGFYRSSFRSRWSPYRRRGGGMTGSGEPDRVTVTPVPTSNLIILRGPEGKVYKAEQLIAELDAQARPDGPMIKVYELEHADVYDVVSTLEEMVGGVSGGMGSLSSYGGGYGSRSRGRSSGGGPVIIQSDMYAKRIIVSAPYEKIPVIEQIIEMKERMAEPGKMTAEAGARGEVLEQSSDGVTKSYTVAGSAEDIARSLDKILVDRFGYWEAPYVKSFPYGNEVIVTGKPEHFKEVEKWLEKLEKNPPPAKIMLMFKRVKSGDAGKIVRLLQQYASPEMQEKINVEAIPTLKGRSNPLDHVREIDWDEPIETSSTPFVPDGTLARMTRELAVLNWAAGAKITVAERPGTEDAGRADATDTGPGADAQATATQPAGSDLAAAAVPTAAGSDAPAESREEQARLEIQKAAVQAFSTGQTQIKYDEDEGLIYVVGPSSDLEKLQDVLDAIIQQFEDIEQEPSSNIRVFRMRHLDVLIAATVLEQMFNEQAKAAQRRPQPKRGAKKPKAGADKAPSPDDEEGSAGFRRREQEEEQAEREEEEARRSMGGQRIRVFPNPRDQTLVIRAAEEDFPAIAELLLKIDRPADKPPVDIQIFQLKRLNAYEVEQALKAILKIDQDQNRLRSARRSARGARGRTGGMRAEAMIEELEQQVLEMQAEVATGDKGEGKLKLNPAKDITITSDATTNSIIVSAPDDGMKLVRKLIDNLEELDIPTRIETIQVQHAEATKVAEELQKVFQATSRGRSKAAEGVKPSQMGKISIAADPRTNTLVVRALEPDMQKVRPIIKELDIPPFDRQVQLYPIEHGDASAMANTLSTIFVQDPSATGPRAVKITADTQTNTVLVWAPEAQQKIIGERIMALQERTEGVTRPREIVLTYSSPTSVAEKLKSIFIPKGSRSGAQRIMIEGDDNSGAIFVAAPDEVFDQIQELAQKMDKATSQDIRVYELKNASATEVLARFKEMMGQILMQLRSTGQGTDEVFAATADERTNSLIVAGNPTTHSAVAKVLKDLDAAPSDATAVTTQMFTLARGNAASVAQTVNTLYRGKKWKSGVPAPTAAAEPTANVVYVTGTKAQIAEIKTTVIDPLEGYSPPATPAVAFNDYQIPVKHAKVEDLANTLNQWFNARFTALKRAGETGRPPAEMTVSILAEPATQQLLVSASESNKKLIDQLLEKLDTPEVTDIGQQMRVFPIKFADLAYTIQALQTTFRKSGRVPPNEQVLITPEYGTQSVIVKAPPDDMKEIEELITKIDKSDAGSITPPETIRLEHAKASDLASTLNTMIRQTKRRDRTTGMYPMNVIADDVTNSLIVTALNPTSMEEIKRLVAQFDVEPPTADERLIRSYPLEYADLNATYSAINTRFAANAKKPPSEQVSLIADWSTNSLVISASEENHAIVKTIIKELDKSDLKRSRPPEIVKVENMRASELAKTLDQIIRATKKLDRRTRQYPVTVTANDAANSLLITANEADLEEMKGLIAKLDVPMETDSERVAKVYPVEYANIYSVSQIINKRFEQNKNLGINEQVDSAVERGTNTLVVTASPDNHEEIASLIAELDVSNIASRDNYPLDIVHGEAEEIARTLSRIYDQAMPRRQPGNRVPAVFNAVRGSNRIIVTTTQDELAQVKALVAELDKPPDLERRDLRVIPVTRVTPREMSAMLREFMQKPGGRRGDLMGDIKIMDSDSANAVVLAGPADRLDELEQLAERVDTAAPEDGKSGRQVELIRVNNGDPRSIARTVTQAFRKRGQVAEVDLVSAVPELTSQSIIVTAAAKKMEEIRALVDRMDQDSGDQSQQEIIRLENAQADELARALTQTFRSRRPPPGQQRASITADSSSNALLVSASKSDMQAIREMVTTLDQPPDADAEELRVIPLEYIDATETQEIMMEYLRKPGTRIGRGGAGDNLVGGLRIQASPTMNALIVSGSEAEIDRVQRIVQGMDKEVVGASAAPKIISLEHASASELTNVLTQLFTDPAKQRSRRSRSGGDVIPLIMADESTNSLIVRAKTMDFNLIEEMVGKLDTEPEGPSGMDVIRVARGVDVRNLAREIERTINQGENMKARKQRGYRPAQVSIGVDERVPALLVAGSPELFKTVRMLVDKLESMKPSGGVGARIIRTKNISPDDIEKLIQQLNSRQGSGGRRRR